MAVKTIAELPTKTQLANADVFIVDDGDHNYKITYQQLLALLPCVSTFTKNDLTGTISLTLTDGTPLSIVPHDPTKLNTSSYTDFTGASQSGQSVVAGTAGRVPAPTALNKYLSSNGIWETPDTTPTQGSAKLLTSGAAYNVLAEKVSIEGNAGFHNSIFRGKNLGTSYTAEQKAAVAAGTFDDMFIGDYWVINGVTWRIAHFDYWLKCGDTGGVGFCQTHHIVIVPDSVLNFKNMNDKVNNADVTTGAYINSKMYTTNLADGKDIVKAAFGESNILTKREYFANAVTNGYESGGAWVDSQIDLMNEKMVYGCDIFHNCINGTSFPHNYTIDKSQLALFRLDPSFIVALHTNLTDRTNWWLRDVVSATYFAHVYGHGYAHYYGASNSRGVRPAFGIK